MSRLSVTASLAAIGALLLSASLPMAAAASSGSNHAVRVQMPASAVPGRLTEITVTLPKSVAAVDGRLLVVHRSAQLIGVAPVGTGVALRPESVKGGFAFGAYGLKAVNGHTVLRLVVNPLKAGNLHVRVLIDSMAKASGERTGTSSAHAASTVVGGRLGALKAPKAASVASYAPTRSASAVRKLLGPGTVSSQDIDAARLAWYQTRVQGTVCADARDDANGDGCVDIVDVQALRAAAGHAGAIVGGGKLDRAAATPIPGLTFTVNSTGDTVDANRGDGICADASGNCTLRAAIGEADWRVGDDRIEFNIPGGAPQLIQLTGSLPIITSKKGTLTIDGYTEPGAHANTAQYGSNALQGVEIRGNGPGAHEAALRISSFNNTIRGLAISNVWRGVLIDGVNAHDNLIIGNWIGYNRFGQQSSGDKGVLVNTGATNNRIGTPDLADRNVIDGTKAIDHYGPGTNGNVTQNNMFCMTPTGGRATCSTAVDHDFGPKNGLIGGDGVNERNYMGPTTLQAVEFSHGWNPNIPWGTDTETTYQINNNQVVGNWLGFTMDGHYNSLYRSGLSGGGDNGNGINIYDGSNDNIARDNYIASVFDGVQTMAPNAKRNIIRGNTIGVSPNGEAAPLTGWGVRLRWQAQYDVVDSNTIRNAASGGIGMTMNTVYNITITRNIISDTNGPAILFTPNPGNPSTGSNQMLAAPTISTASTSVVKGGGIVGATVEVFKASRPAGGSNQGLPIAFLGSAVVNGNGNWSVPVSGLVAGDRVTATQTRTDKTTSQLAVNVAVIQAGPADPRIAVDDFERTVNSGWGNAVIGGPWTISNPASDYTVNGAGHMAVPAGQVHDASLSLDTAVADVTITGQLNFAEVPDGGNAFAYVDARRNGNTAYRASFRLAKTGVLYAQIKKSVNNVESTVGTEVATGLTLNATSVVGFRFTLVGDHLQLRAWDATTAEPSTWLSDLNDASITAAGNLAVRAFVGSQVLNGPVTVSFDNFAANPAP